MQFFDILYLGNLIGQYKCGDTSTAVHISLAIGNKQIYFWLFRSNYNIFYQYLYTRASAGSNVTYYTEAPFILNRKKMLYLKQKTLTVFLFPFEILSPLTYHIWLSLCGGELTCLAVCLSLFIYICFIYTGTCNC